MANYWARRRGYAKLEREFAQKQRELADKTRQLARVQTDEVFLEDEVRRHLGLIRADEIEFRFVPASDASSERMEVSKTRR